jgi:very-short-patch-repair endonuclease
MKEFAKELRQNLTPAEAILWTYLKNKKLGYKFRRQFVFQNYILDFYCIDLKLGIEVDGGVHLDIINQVYDEVRENNLNKLGVTVIRFTNEEVYEDIDLVLQNIKENIVKLKM